MILLIGGGTHTGKTLAAQRVLERYGYPYLSIDHLKMGLIRAGICPLTPEHPDAALTDYLWPIVREMVKTALENGQNLTVEGCYIPYDWADDFTPEERAQMRGVWLVLSPAYIERHYDDIVRHENAIERRAVDAAPTRAALLRENADHLAQCRRHGCEVLLIDGTYRVELTL